MQKRSEQHRSLSHSQQPQKWAGVLLCQPAMQGNLHAKEKENQLLPDHVKKKEYGIFYSTAVSPPAGWQVRYVCPFQKTNVPYLQNMIDYIGAIQKLGSQQIHNPGGWTNY